MDLSPEFLNCDPEKLSSRISDLKQQYKIFAEEAFIYLLDHFGIRTRNEWMFRFFSDEMGRAVITIGYIFRRRIRTFFKTSQMNPSDADDFDTFADYFEIIKTPCYFFRILRRVSHIFELTLYCLREGHDYTKKARNVVAYHEDILYFETNGGWSRLQETASLIAKVGEILQPVIRMENPQEVRLKSFVETVKLLETSSSPTITPMQRETIELFKIDAMKKFNKINTDFRVVRVFYNIICQNSSCVFAMNSRLVFKHSKCRSEFKLDIESEMDGIVNSFRNLFKILLGETEDFYLYSPVTHKLAGYFADFRHFSDIISTHLDMPRVNPKTGCKPSLLEKSCESLNAYFIVDDIEEKKSLAPKSLRQRKAESTTRKILRKNIERNKYFQLKDGRYVVYRGGCKFDCNTITIYTLPG